MLVSGQRRPRPEPVHLLLLCRSKCGRFPTVDGAGSRGRSWCLGGCGLLWGCFRWHYILEHRQAVGVYPPVERVDVSLFDAAAALFGPRPLEQDLAVFSAWALQHFAVLQQIMRDALARLKIDNSRHLLAVVAAIFLVLVLTAILLVLVGYLCFSLLLCALLCALHSRLILCFAPRDLGLHLLDGLEFFSQLILVAGASALHNGSAGSTD